MVPQQGSPSGESLSRAERLRKRADYLRCYRKGRRQHGALSTLYSTPNELSHARLGITVSKQVGGAVIRFRLKRRIREIYRRWRERSRLPMLDLVVHMKPPAAQASFGQLQKEVLRHLRGVMRSGRPGS